MRKLRKQSKSNRAVSIFTFTTKGRLIKNEKEAFPFNDFGDFEEDKWSIFFFLFPPPSPSHSPRLPDIDIFVIITS